MSRIIFQNSIKNINARVVIPGSKSYTNRALFLASLVRGKVTIKNPLLSEDTKVMMQCLQNLGAKAEMRKNNLVMTNGIKVLPNKTYKLNCGLSGITMRFFTALATILPGTQIITGEKRLRERPIKDLVDSLKNMGASIEYFKKPGFLPIKISSQELKTGIIKINGGTSSQHISALLIIAPLIGEMNIKITGSLISRPYIDMTVNIMRNFGVNIIKKNNREYYILAKQNYTVRSYQVEGDYSSACYFFAIAALTCSTITVGNLKASSIQADRKFLDILEQMGSKVIYSKNQVMVKGRGVCPIKVNMLDCPDQIQTLAVMAAFALGRTEIKGIKSLRVKETDRVKALLRELSKMGIKTKVNKNSMIIFGGHPRPGVINTYNDHRMAMSFAVAGAKLQSMEIMNPDVVGKTYPQFWRDLRSIGLQLIKLK